MVGHGSFVSGLGFTPGVAPGQSPCRVTLATCVILNLVVPLFKISKAHSTLRSSRAVPHPSTNRALRRLTSEVGRDPVHSTRYGRQRTCWSPECTVMLGRPILPRITGSMEPRCCNVLCCGMLPQVFGCLAVGPCVSVTTRLIPPSVPASARICSPPGSYHNNRCGLQSASQLTSEAITTCCPCPGGRKVLNLPG